MKKMLILASLAALMLTGVPVAEAETTTTSTTPFTDVSGHWAENEIQKLYIAGVLNQTDAFRPDDLVTRGELITMFVKAKGIKPTETKKSSFADVPSDSWLAPYAETAYRLGIVHGLSQGNQLYLRPNDPIKRQVLASILIRTMGDSGAVNQFPWSTTNQILAKYSDGNAVEQVFQRPIAYAVQQGLMNPYGDGTIKPVQWMTRAEAATYAALHLLGGSAGEQKLAGNGTPYRKVMTVKATAYTYNSSEPLSYLEYPMREGVVAVDPAVIPLGSHMYIDGYGYAVAADIGGAVKQNHVDLFLPSYSKAEQYGIKQGVKVYLLD